MAQTSDRVSRIAARLAKVETGDIFEACHGGTAKVQKLVDDIQAVAASALRQDETKGGLVRKLFKRG